MKKKTHTVVLMNEQIGNFGREIETMKGAKWKL